MRAFLLAAMVLGPFGLLSACSASHVGASSPQAAIGTWRIIEHNGNLLLKMNVTRSDGSFDGNQFIVSASQVGMSDGLNPSHRLHFEIVRDAGTFNCVGGVSGRRAGGLIVSFTANEDFLQDKSLRAPSQRDALKFALFNIDRRTIRDAIKENASITNDQVVSAAVRERFARQDWTH